MHWLEMQHKACYHFRTTFTDVNECEINMDSCDVNADCTNTDGSYTSQWRSQGGGGGGGKRGNCPPPPFFQGERVGGRAICHVVTRG